MLKVPKSAPAKIVIENLGQPPHRLAGKGAAREARRNQVCNALQAHGGKVVSEILD